MRRVHSTGCRPTWRLVLEVKVILLAFSMTLSGCLGEAQYLFRQSQGGSAQLPAGLWGGSVDSQSDGGASDLYKYGYSSPTFPSLIMHSVSYDELSNETLVIVDQGGPSATSGPSVRPFTGLVAPLCQANTGQVRQLFSSPNFTDPDNRFLFDADCAGKCGWGPFAYHRGRLYFILSAVWGHAPARLTRRIELRELTSCTDPGQTISAPLQDFHLLQCSRQLVLLHEEQYTKPRPNVKIWSSQSLKAENINGEDYFFLQLFDTSVGEPMLRLVMVRPQSNSTSVLHTTFIAHRYTDNHLIQGFGSVDYKDGFLCWTSTDTLYCADVMATSFEPRPLVFPGEANTEGVCTGSAPVPELERALTGVAIAEVSSSLSVYFGCYAELSGVGGVGLVRVESYGLSKSILSVRSANQKVYGGILFLTHNVQDHCTMENTSPNTSPAPTTDTTSTTTPTPPKHSPTSPVLITSTQGQSTKYDTVGSSPSTGQTIEEPLPTIGAASTLTTPTLTVLVGLCVLGLTGR